jgi:hypothetical protein
MKIRSYCIEWLNVPYTVPFGVSFVGNLPHLVIRDRKKRVGKISIPYWKHSYIPTMNFAPCYLTSTAAGIFHFPLRISSCGP